ncbi:MAG: hypothetical protein R3321_02555 [Nitrososphaeraceae archaeon]|nr:hypothetical protein [Nitrososphaeraceae archaeon]
MVNGNGKGSSQMLATVASKFLFGMGAGIISEAFIEITNFPLLNETGMFGNSSSNFETISYAIVTGGIAAGLVDLFTTNRILGFSKDILPFLAGYGIGIQQYNTWIGDRLGIRRFDPYGTVGGAIPQLF